MALPLVLAGPLIQRLTPTELQLWVVTSQELDQRKVAAEVWDPLPPGIAGYMREPGPGNLPLAGLVDIEVRMVARTLFVSRLTLRASRPWPRNRALAYRVALTTGTDWLMPASTLPLPGDPGPMPARQATASAAPFPHAWFSIDPLDLNWAVLSLHGKAPATWAYAATYLERTSRGKPLRHPQPNPRGPNVDPHRPTTALLFGADVLAVDAAGISALATVIAQGEPLRGWALARYLLALSPVCCQLAHTSPVTANALATIAGHVPLFGIPSALFGDVPAAAILLGTLTVPAVGRTFEQAALDAFGLVFAWGNMGEHPLTPSTGTISAATSYVTGSSPAVRIAFSQPQTIDAPGPGVGTSQVVIAPYLILGTPRPVLPLVRRFDYQPPPLGSLDNLFGLSADEPSYIATPEGQVDPGARLTIANARLNPNYLSGEPERRIYQQTIASGPGSSAPQLRTGVMVRWDATQSLYKDTSTHTPALAAVATFGILTSETGAGIRGYRSAIFTDADHAIAVAIPGVGKRVMSMQNADIFIGNRFRTNQGGIDPDVAKHGQLGGIIVTVGARTVTTTADGLAPGLLAQLSDGRHALAIGGPLTQALPPGPSTAPRQARLWRQRTFSLMVEQGRVIQVDEERITSPGVRLLVDPVYMQLISGISQSTPTRSGPVTLVVIHRTEGADAAHSLDTWMKTPATRFNDALQSFRAGHPSPPTAAQVQHMNEASHVAAPYILARDGTLIKTARDTSIVNHAGGHWGDPAVVANVSSNERSVGIEISKLHDELSPYTEAQYAHVLWLLGEYCAAGVHPYDVVGHGDVRDAGKDDPGLHFEWSRLEAEGFGIRRPNALEREAPTIVVRPLSLPETVSLDFADLNPQDFRTYHPAMVAAFRADRAKYRNLFRTELAAGGHAADRAVIATVRAALQTIGYHQDLTRGPKAEPALASFRSRIFSGVRRTLFALERGPAVERLRLKETTGMGADDDFDNRAMFELTAVWAKLVADFVTTTRPSPSSPRRQPLPPAPR